MDNQTRALQVRFADGRQVLITTAPEPLDGARTMATDGSTPVDYLLSWDRTALSQWCAARRVDRIIVG